MKKLVPPGLVLLTGLVAATALGAGPTVVRPLRAPTNLGFKSCLATAPRFVTAPPNQGLPVGERAVLRKSCKWAKQVLKVRFLEGDPLVQDRVRKTAATWSEFAGITFDFGDHPTADIRIAFQAGKGSWSYVGTCSVTEPEATMNFGWLTRSSSDDEVNRVVLHEFGHALGLEHEHQSPENDIPWDKPKVYEHYARIGWGKTEVDDFVFKRLSRSETNFSQFDRQSIMLYAVDNEMTVGDYEVPWNTKLSATDKSFIGQWYPKTTAPPAEVVAPQHGLAAEYFADGALTGAPVARRVDPTVAFEWGDAAPAPGVPASKFSARWTGFVDVKSAGDYRFFLTTVRGVRLWVGGKVVIDRWSAPTASAKGADDAPTWVGSSAVTLPLGRVPLKLEMGGSAGASNVKLSWLGLDRPEAGQKTIPRTALYTAETGGD